MGKTIYTDTFLLLNERGKVLLEDADFQLTLCEDGRYQLTALSIDMYYVILSHEDSYHNKEKVIEILKGLNSKGIEISLETDMWLAKNVL